MSRNSPEKRLKKWKRPDVGPARCMGTIGASYLLATENGAGGPWQIGEHAAHAARHPAGGEDHQGALGFHGFAGEAEGKARALPCPLRLDPFDRDEHLVESRGDPLGVGIGVEDHIRPHGLEGVDRPRHRRRCRWDDCRRRSGVPVSGPSQGPRPERRLPAIGIRNPSASDSRQGPDRVGHAPGLAVVEDRVEGRSQQRPGRAGRQMRRAFGDQDVDDMVPARQGGA